MPPQPEDGVRLGFPLKPTDQPDAIHIAVAPVTVMEDVRPGAHVGFHTPGDVTCVSSLSDKPIGIIDPFLSGVVSRGSRVWLFLYPHTVTSLRHTWTHPAFEEQAAAAKAAAWAVIDSFVAAMRCDYGDGEDGEYAEACRQRSPTRETVMEAAEEYLRSGNLYCLSFDTPDAAYRRAPEFWNAYAVVTGAPTAGKDDSFFRCAC